MSTKQKQAEFSACFLLQYNGYTQPQRLGGYNSGTYSSASSGYGNTVKTAYSQPAATKPKAVGPNAEMGRTTAQQKEEVLKKKYIEYLTGAVSRADNWGVPKTIKDGAHPKQPAKTAPKSIGPNAETAKTNYLDHSNDNPLEILNDQIRQRAENADNYLLKTPEQTEDYGIIVTKDNVRYIPLSEDEKLIRDIADEVEKELKELKIQKAEIELNQRHSLGINGESMDTYYVDAKIKKAEQILDIINYYEDAKSEEIKNYLISLENNGVYNELNSDNDLNDIYPTAVKSKQSFDEINDNTNPYLSPFDKLVMEKGKDNKYVIKIESDFSKEFSFNVKSIGEEYGEKLYKIVVDKVDYDKLNYTQEAIISKINNAVITKSQLDELQKIIKTGKKLGRISEAMDIIGKGFDLWELGTIIEKDRADDGKLEKQSVQQAAKLTGELIGDATGTAIGVPLGAAAGFAVGGPPGAAVGIMAGPVIASSVLSELGGLLAEYLGGVTYDWEYSAHQYERWK